MKAVIFYAMGQKFLANRIQRLFAEHGEIVQCCQLEITNVNYRLERNEIEYIKEYVGYLNAARRNPNQVYFLPSYDSYGYIRYIWGRYSNYTVAKLDLELTDGLFPAIALDNRMVIMPLGVLDLVKMGKEYSETQDRILKDQNEDQYFGISEVDFLSEEQLRTCLREKIAVSMSNIERAIANYLSFHGGVSDVKRIAEALDITVACAQVGVNRNISSDRGELVAGLAPNTFQVKEWHLATLCLTNNSGVDIRCVGAEIEGPIEMRKLSVQGTLAPSQSIFLPLHIRPIEKGNFPLDIRVRKIEADQEVLKSVGVEWVTVM